MTWLFLRPDTPLLFRDGRLFEGHNHGPSLSFPMPQALLGAARTRAGERLHLDWDHLDHPFVGTPEAPGRLRVRHVLYARRGRDGRIEPLLPRPADLIRFPPDTPARVSRKDEHFPTDHAMRPAGDAEITVSLPVGLTQPLRPLFHRPPTPRRKPVPPDHVPAHLGLGEYASWLCTRGAEVRRARSDVADPQREHRVHVAIDNNALTGADGMLFSTERLVMPHGPDTFGLAVALDGIEPGDPDLAGPWRLGGKGGLALAEVETGMDAALDVVRDAVFKSGFPDGRIRWVLTAPARFDRGWLPDFVRSDATGEIAGVPVTLVAAAVPRSVAYSGWDLQFRGSDGEESARGRAGGGPRPTRLLVPAGSTYFFEAHGTEGRSAAEAASHIAREAWLRALARPQGTDTASMLDAACGLATGVFGPFDAFTEVNHT